MAKESAGKQEYDAFIAEVVEMIIDRAEKEDKTEDLVESAVDIIKSDPVFRKKILGYIFSNPQLKSDFRAVLIDDMCD